METVPGAAEASTRPAVGRMHRTKSRVTDLPGAAVCQSRSCSEGLSIHSGQETGWRCSAMTPLFSAPPKQAPPLGGVSPCEPMPWEGCVNKFPLFAPGTGADKD